MCYIFPTSRSTLMQRKLDQNFISSFHFFVLTYSFTHHFSSSDSPLCTSLTPSLFHSRLKPTSFTNHIPQFHFFLPDCLHGSLPGPSVSSKLLCF